MRTDGDVGQSRDKARYSLLMEKRVSDSLWLAEGVCCVQARFVSVRGRSMWRTRRQ